MEAVVALFIWYSQHTEALSFASLILHFPLQDYQKNCSLYTHYHSTLVYSLGSYKCTQSLFLLHDLHNKLENTSKLCVIVFSGYSLLYTLAFLNLDILSAGYLFCSVTPYSALQEITFIFKCKISDELFLHFNWGTPSVFNCNSVVDLPEHLRFIRVEIFFYKWKLSTLPTLLSF